MQYTKLETNLRTYHGVSAVQMKNWDPFVFFPAFAIDSVPGKERQEFHFHLLIAMKKILWETILFKLKQDTQQFNLTPVQSTATPDVHSHSCMTISHAIYTMQSNTVYSHSEYARQVIQVLLT